MSLAYWCVLACAVLPYVWVAVAKVRPGYNNRNPRAWAGKSEDYLVQRAHAAHLNAFEAFAPFAAGVLMAQFAGVDHALITQLALAFIACRVLHGVFYLAAIPLMRSLIWFGGIGCVVALMVQAALKIGG